MARDWQARGFDVRAIVPPFSPPDAVVGVIPTVRATASGRDVVVILAGCWSSGPPLLGLRLRFALCEWVLGSAERELCWISR